MTDLPTVLNERLSQAFTAVAGEPTDALLRPSEHADYQANGALALAKELGRPPREVAQEIVDRAELGELVERIDIAGPGFLNVTLADPGLVGFVEQMAADERVDVGEDERTERVLVDYSAPNVAKEMHVGHLRSTIIGDALVRVLEFLGYDVIRENHIGDWGTPFGMLIEHLIDLGVDAAKDELAVGDLTAFYQAAKRKFDEDEGFVGRSRRRVVLLQSGEEQTLALWQTLVEESARYFQQVYDQLGVTLRPDHNVGESAYNELLAPTVAELDRLGLLRESDGAQCLFPAGFTGRDGEPLPIIVRKRDGGYNYSTTDLAGIRQRIEEIKAERLIYLTDLGQQLHFHMVFQSAREAGWLVDPVRAEFVGFGLVLGPDRKRLRTRAGDSVKLADLLEEAVGRAATVVAEKSPHLSAQEQANVARAVGVGAIKYADLSGDRTKDYVFDWDQMLSFDGNTGPYLQYAHARIKSVFRRGEIDPDKLRGTPLIVTDPSEHELMRRLLEFDGSVRRVRDTLEPHRLCGHLYGVATAFTTFYERCPVLKAEDRATRMSRLVLCDLTARVLHTGLDLLGISTPDRM